jgi:2-oxoglutarate dehydrogenase E2 component (dihydrolipoamide succinyltransferase)
MSLFARAAVLALREIPVVNASIDGDDVVYHHRVHLGIAVSTPRGLVVPVVRNADALSLAELERAVAGLAERARAGRLAPDDLAGGTFTITNGGVFGSLLSTPILNPPQSGILGMHKIEDRPRAVNGQVVIRPMMYVALSYDHRLVDGAQAVTFLVRVKESLEDPARMVLDV